MISSWLRSGWRARLTAVAMTPAVSEMISSISRGVTHHLALCPREQFLFDAI